MKITGTDMIPGLQYQINKQRRVENGEDGVEALRGGWTRSASMAGSQSFFGNVAAMTLEEARGRIGDGACRGISNGRRRILAKDRHNMR